MPPAQRPAQRGGARRRRRTAPAASSNPARPGRERRASVPAPPRPRRPLLRLPDDAVPVAPAEGVVPAEVAPGDQEASGPRPRLLMLPGGCPGCAGPARARTRRSGKRRPRDGGNRRRRGTRRPRDGGHGRRRRTAESVPARAGAGAGNHPGRSCCWVGGPPGSTCRRSGLARCWRCSPTREPAAGDDGVAPADPGAAASVPPSPCAIISWSTIRRSP